MKKRSKQIVLAFAIPIGIATSILLKITENEGIRLFEATAWCISLFSILFTVFSKTTD